MSGRGIGVKRKQSKPLFSLKLGVGRPVIVTRDAATTRPSKIAMELGLFKLYLPKEGAK